LKTDYLKNGFCWAHIIWAIAGLSLCYWLVTLEGGHPSGIVFVPIAAAIWLAGHLLLWLSRKLANYRKYSADNKSSASRWWLLMLLVLVFLCGIVFIFGILFLVSFFV